jgi:hypothetical protein
MARPNKGLAHVDGLPGDPELKYRLKVVLATITGEMLVDEACDELDLGPTQFANLRRQVLLAGLEALQPRPVGRPRRAVDGTPEQVEAMRQRIAELEHDLTILRSRIELSVLPLLEGPRRSKSRRRTSPPTGGPRPASAP